MKVETIKVYVADDGKRFRTAEACENWEARKRKKIVPKSQRDDIYKKFKAGASRSALAREYGLARSTVDTIISENEPRVISTFKAPARVLPPPKFAAPRFSVTTLRVIERFAISTARQLVGVIRKDGYDWFDNSESVTDTCKQELREWFDANESFFDDNP